MAFDVLSEDRHIGWPTKDQGQHKGWTGCMCLRLIGLVGLMVACGSAKPFFQACGVCVDVIAGVVWSGEDRG